jgi:hypothetical protein
MQPRAQLRPVELGRGVDASAALIRGTRACLEEPRWTCSWRCCRENFAELLRLPAAWFIQHDSYAEELERKATTAPPGRGLARAPRRRPKQPAVPRTLSPTARGLPTLKFPCADCSSGGHRAAGTVLRNVGNLDHVILGGPALLEGDVRDIPAAGHRSAGNSPFRQDGHGPARYMLIAAGGMTGLPRRPRRAGRRIRAIGSTTRRRHLSHPSRHLRGPAACSQPGRDVLRLQGAAGLVRPAGPRLLGPRRHRGPRIPLAQ